VATTSHNFRLWTSSVTQLTALVYAYTDSLRHIISKCFHPVFQAEVLLV